jgi:hypothetical protein
MLEIFDLAMPLARRSDFFEKLFDGDPVAWVCLSIGVVVAVGGGFIKKKLRGR